MDNKKEIIHHETFNFTPKKLDEEKELHKNELEDINSEFNYNIQSKIINL